MKITKTLTNLFLCLALLLSSSCVTKYIWGDKSYEERIDQFLAGADGRYIVFVGQDYHYIFTDNTAILKTVLSLRQQGILTINLDKTHLKLNSNNDIAGDFVMSGPFNLLPVEDRGVLQALGFRPDKYDNVTIKVKLSGRRYVAKYLGSNLPSLSTNAYTMPIYYNDSGIVKGVGKAAITPIAVGLDAVLFIGKIVVYPLSFGS